MPNAATQDGAALIKTDTRNRNVDYPDVEASPHAQLLCLGTETYGRWSQHALTLMRHLARYKSNNTVFYLRRSVECAFFARSWSILSLGIQKIVCGSILRASGSDLVQAAASLHPVPVEDMLDFHR